MNCPICSKVLRCDWKNILLSVYCCSNCRHRTILHHKLPDSPQDYHAQYDAGTFLDSLAQTRIRQAKLIRANLTSLLNEDDKILDFGCGRGFFLRYLKDQGKTQLAGCDTSQIALDLLGEIGIEGLLCQIKNDAVTFSGGISFQPRIISFLDVIEHFGPDTLLPMMNSIFAQFPSVEVLIVKVPVVEGLLFRLASLMRRVGVMAPINQLFQVSTDPPHYHYFSDQSVTLLMKSLGFQINRIVRDRDFDDFTGRLNFSGPFLRACGPVLNFILKIMSLVVGGDTQIVIATREP